MMGESERPRAVRRNVWLVCFLAAIVLSAVLDLALGVPTVVRWVVVITVVVAAVLVIDTRTRRR